MCFKKLTHLKTVLVTFICLTMLAPMGNKVIAQGVGTEQEREMLARLVSELETIRILVRQTSEVSSTDRRIKINYRYLSEDLKTIQAGLEEALGAPSTEPQKIPKLYGNYVK